MTDDQMQQMRLQKQRQPRSCRKSDSKKERRETLRENGATSMTTSTKPWDVESSADSSLRSACASCVQCPVTGSAADDGIALTPTSRALIPDAGDPHDEGDYNGLEANDPLSQRPLEFVSLSGCYRVTDDGLLYLAGTSSRTIEEGLPNLRHLDLSGCMNVSVEGLLPVLETCPLINFSHLFYCDNVFLGEGIDDLASGCRNLQRGRVCCRTGL